MLSYLLLLLSHKRLFFMLHFYKKISKTDWLLIGIYWGLAYVYIVPVFFVYGRILETIFLSFIEIIARTFLAVTIVFLLFPATNSVKTICIALIKASLLLLVLTHFL
jgi:hypothetical protein